MKICYNIKTYKIVEFVVAGASVILKDKSKDNINFKDKMLSQDLDKVLTKTNTIVKIKTNNTPRENTVIVYVDLNKIKDSDNVIYDDMYRYMLTKLYEKNRRVK